MHPQDAAKAVSLGIDGIQVSNHGGRQVEGLPASVDVLPAVVAQVGERATVLFDSGVRSGLDVVRALALGAKAAFAGKAFRTALGQSAGRRGLRDQPVQGEATRCGKPESIPWHRRARLRCAILASGNSDPRWTPARHNTRADRRRSSGAQNALVLRSRRRWRAATTPCDGDRWHRWRDDRARQEFATLPISIYVLGLWVERCRSAGWRALRPPHRVSTRHAAGAYRADLLCGGRAARFCCSMSGPLSAASTHPPTWLIGSRPPTPRARRSGRRRFLGFDRRHLRRDCRRASGHSHRTRSRRSCLRRPTWHKRCLR